MTRIILLFLLITGTNIYGLSKTDPQKRITAEEYIEKFKEHAIKEMLLYNIPASITLAQGMLESGNGNSDLAIYANNHFGIKCHKDWEGPSFIKDDDQKNECFRKYPSVLDSYTDHSVFLTTRQRYAKLFELDHTDYKNWAKGLKEAGYATDPNYPKRLIELIEKYELYKLDTVGRNKNSVTEKTTVVAEKTTKHKEAVHKNNVTTKHEIFQSGIIKYVIIKPGDTFFSIANETDKDLWQLYKYNELNPEDKLVVGDRLYLQPKRKKGTEDFHIVKKGESMRSISQLHCIKLKWLYKRNNMNIGEEPKIGETLYLKKNKPKN